MDIVTIEWGGKGESGIPGVLVDHHIWLGETDAHGVGSWDGNERALFLRPVVHGESRNTEVNVHYDHDFSTSSNVIYTGPLSLDDMRRDVITHEGVVAEVKECGKDNVGCWGCLGCASALPIGWPF